jgi:dipeptidyl aminopeptidase/acylaminoacyl peptidase
MFKKNHPNGRLAVFGLSLLILLLPLAARGKAGNGDDAEQKLITQRFEALDQRLDQLEKAIDDILWFNKVGDVALIDKVFQYGPPPAKIENPTAMGAQNPVKFWSYIFIPRNIDRNQKHPLLVLPHGGSHANFTTYHTHIIRELMAQGYIVVAPEYRGSTGYGRSFYEKVDYGGLEVDDSQASRAYKIEK